MSSNIKDVAKLANVSISTVSRVINNAPNVQPETREKVMAAVKKLNFKPNRIAQSLGGGSFNSIGVVSARSSNQAFVPLALQSISEVADKKGYEIILNNSTDELKEIEKCLSMINSKVIQGLILLSSKVNDLLIEKLYEINFPFVVMGKVSNDYLAKRVYTVDTDNVADCKEAVNYLIECNHKRIACIHAPLNYVVSKERLDGYIEAHKEALLPVDYSLIANGGYDINEAYEATLKLLKSPNPPTAIFATDDIKAVGAYKAILELGLKIPEDISIIGHNNYDISQITTPPLTTIDVPILQLGKVTTEILFNLIEGKIPPVRTLLDTKFIVRGSCRKL
ncbi:LacI family DNA-binding transcriptional regulator [Clostridium thermarum]|uniref:LacI family DNA-binding transcriptional regulator n=1 Tax=Clostridium thermarum TaxID=1716543 RepID=UPI00111CB8A5|nr:LacI family DNA-binding transcriptional regulator [Clostridium thermarum]